LTITKVKTPWFLFPFLLKRLFIQSKPEYSKLPGLALKFYHTADRGANFGGIYLWHDKASADNQFNAQWFERVRKRLKCEGRVDYFSVLDHQVSTAPDFDYHKLSSAYCLLVKSNDILPADTMKEKGVLESFQLQQGAQSYILWLFSAQKQVMDFIHQLNSTSYELFRTPVLLKNL
ncbi:MAG: hypothetical protein EBU52_18745, partial [Cytophagia bacterium]|nr:hypothetical protein [Cytophagia bacterium]